MTAGTGSLLDRIIVYAASFVLLVGAALAFGMALYQPRTPTMAVAGPEAGASDLAAGADFGLF